MIIPKCPTGYHDPKPSSEMSDQELIDWLVYEQCTAIEGARRMTKMFGSMAVPMPTPTQRAQSREKWDAAIERNLHTRVSEIVNNNDR